MRYVTKRLYFFIRGTGRFNLAKQQAGKTAGAPQGGPGLRRSSQQGALKALPH